MMQEQSMRDRLVEQEIANTIRERVGQGDARGALRLSTQYLENHHQAPCVMRALAHTLKLIDRTEDAKRILSKVLENDPQNQAAQDEFAELTAPGSRPKDKRDLVLGAAFALEAGNIEQAGDYYKRILDANPNDDKAAVAIARIAFKCGKVDQAVTMLEEILVKNPTSTYAISYLAFIYERNKDFAKAKEFCIRGLELGEDRHTLAVAARIALADNDLVKEHEYLTRLLRLTPDAPIALYKLGLNEFRRDQPEALETLSKALALAPKDVYILTTLAQIHMAERRLAEADELLQTAKEVAPGDATTRVLLGKLNLVRGDTKAAEREFKAAGKDNFYASSALGYTLLRVGDAAGALNAFEQSLRVNQRDVIATQGATLALFRLGKYELALEYGIQCLQIEFSPRVFAVLEKIAAKGVGTQKIAALRGIAIAQNRIDPSEQPAPHDDELSDFIGHFSRSKIFTGNRVPHPIDRVAFKVMHNRAPRKGVIAAESEMS